MVQIKEKDIEKNIYDDDPNKNDVDEDYCEKQENEKYRDNEEEDIVDEKEILEGTHLAYYQEGQKFGERYKQDFGIYCNYCQKVVCCSEFEVHARWGKIQAPYRHIYLLDGSKEVIELAGCHVTAVSGGEQSLGKWERRYLIKLENKNRILVIWDFFTSQNAVDIARWKLQEHNDLETCCKELVDEAIKHKTMENITAIMVFFHSEPPPILLSIDHVNEEIAVLLQKSTEVLSKKLIGCDFFGSISLIFLQKYHRNNKFQSMVISPIFALMILFSALSTEPKSFKLMVSVDCLFEGLVETGSKRVLRFTISSNFDIMTKTGCFVIKPQYLSEFFGWSLDVANRFGILRVTFNTTGAFSTSVYYSLWLHLPHKQTDSDVFPLRIGEIRFISPVFKSLTLISCRLGTSGSVNSMLYGREIERDNAKFYR